MSDQITIKIGGDSKDLTEEVKKVKKSLDGLGSADKGISTLNIAWGSFVGNFASNALSSAMSGLMNIFGGLTNAAIGFAKSAEEDATSLNQMNIAIAQSGDYSKEAAASMAQYVDQIEKSSNFAGPAIAKTAAMIQQMSVLSADALPKATQATADFAAAFSLDIETAGKIVGKAMSGNVEALGKYGIELKSTGDKSKDAAAALELLSDRFGGAALASIQNFTGAQNQLQNKIDDVGKSFFGQITSNAALIGSLQGIGAVFGELQKVVEENKDSISKFVTDGVLFLVDGISLAGEAIAFLVGLYGDVQTFFRFIDDAILASIQTFYELQAGVGDVAANIKEFFGGNADNIRRFVSQAETAVEGFKASREANDAETAQLMANTESKTIAITDFAMKAEQIVKDKVAKAQAAEKQETDQFLQQLNDRAAARGIAGEVETEEMMAKKEFDALYTAENIAAITESLGTEASLREQARIEELTRTGKHNAALKQLKAAQVKAEQESIFAIQKFEEISQKQRLANLQQTLGTVSTLQNESSTELFLIGKAAAIAQATIDGWAGVQKALASAPPPFNFALAALVGTVAAVNVGKIASTPKPTKGAFDGTLVEEGSGYKDDQPYMLSKGEIVAPARNFDEVIEGTARQRGFTKSGESSGGESNLGSNKVIVEISLVDDLIKFVERGLQERRALGITAGGNLV